MLLTIFTPTYNRAHTISRLFDSLCRQNCKEFEWLIVDDGSTDSTSSEVERFKKVADFPIHYVAKENGGKHTAYNTALDIANGVFIFTVDSDDWLPDNAIKSIKILNSILKATEIEHIAGFIGLKQSPSGELIGSDYAGAPETASFSELETLGFGGERTIILKTKVAKLYPFPVLKGERFMGECVVYDRIDANYKLMVINQALTICEYQNDGLTNNLRRIMVNNPGGYAIYYSQRIDNQTSVKQLIGYIIRYNAFRYLFNKKHPAVCYQGRHQALRCLLMPISLLVAIYYSRFK